MLLIKGGRVIDPATGMDRVCDLAVKDGVVKAMGASLPKGDCRVVDAAGLVVGPGLVDVHVHFRDPGFPHKEDIGSGSEAAARGGYTTVVCMANTKPTVDNPETLAYVLERGRGTRINLHTVAAVSKGLAGKELTDMAGLLAAGAVGFSDDGVPLTDTAFLRKAMMEAARLDTPVSLHEEDPALIGTAGVNDGQAAVSLGLTGAPWVSESAMVARDCMLALDTGARVHMQHLSCGPSVAAVRMAKSLGARVTAEVTPQHFALTEDAVAAAGTLAKVNPPLRTEKDRMAVIEGLKDGSIDMIATDHAPHSREEKDVPFPGAPSGMTGSETALALGITHLVEAGHLTLSQLLAKMTTAPAALYGLKGGRIAEGGPADLVIFDPAERWVVEDFASRSANSPFVGRTLTGKVKYTICGGEIVYSDQEDRNG